MPNYQADRRATELRDERDTSTHTLLCEAELVTDPAARQSLLQRAVLLNQSLALALSRRYRHRGVDPEDLAQVAMLGLVKAVRGYCPGLDTPFTAYAVPTIKGEIRRHFRDRGWTIRPPRSLQELSHAARLVIPELAQRLQRMPTTNDIAQHLGVDAIAVADPANPLETVDAVLTLRPALKALGARDRQILRLRFFDNLTQEQIGHHIGVSQMQVSRLLTAILAKLRKNIENPRAV